MTELSISTAQSLLLALVDQPIWGVKRSHGSFFLAEFGAVREILTLPARRLELGRSMPERQVPRGTWALMVELCRWRLQVGELETSDRDEDHLHMQGVMSAFEGTRVSKINIDSDALTFTFSNGSQMKLGPLEYASPDEEGSQWVIFLPGGRKLSRDTSGGLSHE